MYSGLELTRSIRTYVRQNVPAGALIRVAASFCAPPPAAYAGYPAIRVKQPSPPLSSFPGRVYDVVASVPPGRVITYGAIAHVLGYPRKAREVGWAMAATPD